MEIHVMYILPQFFKNQKEKKFPMPQAEKQKWLKVRPADPARLGQGV